MNHTDVQTIRGKVTEAHVLLRRANREPLSPAEQTIIDAIGLLGAALLMMVDAVGRERA